MRKKLELKTPKELEREARHSEIIAEYRSMRNTYSDAPTWRILAELSRRFSITSMGIMRILERHNVYTPSHIPRK